MLRHPVDEEFHEEHAQHFPCIWQCFRTCNFCKLLTRTRHSQLVHGSATVDGMEGSWWRPQPSRDYGFVVEMLSTTVPGNFEAVAYVDCRVLIRARV